MCDTCHDHPVDVVYDVHSSLSCVIDMLGTGDHPIDRDGLHSLLVTLERKLRPAVQQLQGYAPRT